MRHDLQAAKAVVRDMSEALDAAGPEEAAAALSAHVAADWIWRGMHPWDRLTGAEEVAAHFWTPLKRAMGPQQRRPDLLLAGANVMDGGESVWVAEMGHLMGNWDRDWLGLAPPRQLSFLRYVDFHRVEGGRIVETAAFVDLPDMLSRAGYRCFPPQTGAEILTPGPRTHDGLLHAPQDPDEGRRTVDLITAMVHDLRSAAVSTSEDHLSRFWTGDMCWFGPTGIGASAFRSGYRRGHTMPFEEGLALVQGHDHGARIGEGSFGGFFGHPSLTLRSTGGFMGMPASDRPGEMRIVDMYRREGDRLAENWIFIDLLHFFHCQGVDILARLPETT